MRDAGKIAAGDPPPISVHSRNPRRPSAPPLRLVLDFGTSLTARRQGYIIPRTARKGPQALLRLIAGTSFAIASSVVITSPKNSRKLLSVAACSSSVQVALPSEIIVTR
jgi:hypothetical protein